MANWLNFHFAHYLNFKNLTMITQMYMYLYITKKLKNQGAPIFNFVNLNIMGQVAKLKSVYIFYPVVGYKSLCPYFLKYYVTNLNL